ncbi:AI-2E family transporter [Flavonifractor sp. An112]|nr:AI-2E family transporter [Flavonifractor sp. An9]OUN13979.1 AI-2E family transporter [Flavonifractor sp. An91]OUO15340.1 AI-2E family transporter [Flavonifractor sp. An4]OUQ59315.1 AI-2E family transporter [Flavonifractor sp. An112]HIZ94953.1 AI-2E family transporter [Candidatus Flavonifractor avicola]
MCVAAAKEEGTVPEKEDPKNKKKWYILDGSHVQLLIVLIVAILFYVGLNHFSVVTVRINQFMGVLSPFIVGFAIAYLLNTPMCFFERKLFPNHRFKRALSILLVYVLAFAVVAILLGLIVPQVVQSVKDLAGNMQTYLTSLDQLVQDLTEQFDLDADAINDMFGNFQNMISNMTAKAAEALPQLLDVGFAIGSGVIAGITALISSIYMLAGKDRLVPQLKKLLYATVSKRRSDWLLGVCGQANRVFVGFINGKIIDSAIIGVLCFILCAIFRIPYPMLVSVTVGVTNVIPFFGPIIGAIPCLFILVIVDPWAALRFFALVIGLQQFDGNILGPKILGDSTGLSAIWVLISIVTCGGLFGFPGMILGVPTFAVLYALVREWVNKRLKAKKIDGNGKPLEEQPQTPPDKE